jgi:hypothetical protein
LLRWGGARRRRTDEATRDDDDDDDDDGHGGNCDAAHLLMLLPNARVRTIERALLLPVAIAIR